MTVAYLAIASFAAAAAAPPEVPPALRKVADRMRAIHNLQVQLKQEKELAAFGDIIRTQGRMAFARPRKLLMDLSGLGGTTLIIDGDRLTMHYKALGKTEVTELSRDPQARAVAEHLFLLLKADPGPLAEVYTLAVTSESPLTVRLKPKGAALRKIINYVDARFDALGFVSSMTLAEAAGDETRWTFHSPLINQPLPENLFRLQAEAP